jgi:hypothetical protein
MLLHFTLDCCSVCAAVLTVFFVSPAAVGGDAVSPGVRLALQLCRKIASEGLRAQPSRFVQCSLALALVDEALGVPKASVAKRLSKAYEKADETTGWTCKALPFHLARLQGRMVEVHIQ